LVCKIRGKGHFKTADHIKVLQEAIQVLQCIIALDIPVTVLGEGEFDNADIQRLCLANKWNYLLRTACDTVL
jgi:hypothetical protein